MAEFTPKTSQQILTDAVDYLYHNTNLSDFNVGSVIRTILEVMAVEDAEQYFQMFTILESFFLRSATGSSLDDRAKEYDVTRLPATSAIGEVVFSDTNLKRSFLASDLAADASTIYVVDAAEFPAVPFFVQLGEGGQVEQVEISGVTGNTLTVKAPATAPFNVTYSHPAASTGIDEIDNLGSLVTLFDSAQAPRIIPTGVTLRAQPTNVTFSVECVTTMTGTQPNGYFLSSPIKVKSTSVGVQSNIPAKRLNQIVSGSPYSGASVVNQLSIAGGINPESDGEFRDRIRQSVAALPKGTIAAIAASLIGTSDTDTSQIISRARIVENFEEDIVYAYVDDSSTIFSASEERPAQDSLAAPAAPATALTLNSIDGFPTATVSNKIFIIINPLTANTFVTQYQSSSGTTLSNLVPATTSAYAVGDTVTVCEAVDIDIEEDRKYFQLDKYPLGDENPLLYSCPAPGFGSATRLVQLLPGEIKTYDGGGTLVEDFIVNEATGQIEIFEGKVLPTGSSLFATYENYTGLLKEAQTVVDGNLLDLINYPGVRSAGVKVLVRPAKRSAVTVTADITIDNDLTSIDTATFLVRQVIISYINNLDIGNDVIVAEIIDRAMGILGITNCKVISPSDDYTINSDSVAYASDITIL